MSPPPTHTHSKKLVFVSVYERERIVDYVRGIYTGVYVPAHKQRLEAYIEPPAHMLTRAFSVSPSPTPALSVLFP